MNESPNNRPPRESGVWVEVCSKSFLTEANVGNEGTSFFEVELVENAESRAFSGGKGCGISRLDWDFAELSEQAVSKV